MGKVETARLPWSMTAFTSGGNMEKVLERLTALLEENCGNLVERLVGIIDPLLSGVLMVTVGLSLLSVMLPLIGMMNSIG